MDEQDQHHNEQAQQTKRNYKVLSDQQRYAAYVAMHSLCMKNGGKFDKDDKKNVAAFFDSDIQVMQRIWRLAMRQIDEGLEVDVSSRKKEGVEENQSILICPLYLVFHSTKGQL